MKNKKVVIIGGGPAGLMSAQIIAKANHQVSIFDSMPSFGRKFLLAGRGGLNLTHGQPFDKFIQNYFEAKNWLETCIKEFDSSKLRNWSHDLGQETFVGSSGRVFPKSMKASPLLRSWLKLLDDLEVKFYPKYQWQGFEGQNLVFKNPDGDSIHEKFDATLLALGGASWPHLGSNGKWVDILSPLGVEIEKLKPSNCGFITNWSIFFSEKFAGTPIKSVAIKHKNFIAKGEFVITKLGIEGNVVYALSPYLRDTIKSEGNATLFIDLRPEMSIEILAKKLEDFAKKSKNKKSFANYLQKLGFANYTNSLLRELIGIEKINTANFGELANYLKNLPIILTATTNIDRAISSAGGIKKESFDDNFMLKKLSGVFVAGEMLNWEAPTGGYLLQGCFSTAFVASNGVLKFLEK
jgi:uncharacterized flavoprotein (TIGR03862 family)